MSQLGGWIALAVLGGLIVGAVVVLAVWAGVGSWHKCCRVGFDNYPQCDRCAKGYVDYPNCRKETGTSCTNDRQLRPDCKECKEGYANYPSCNECAQDYTGYPDCRPNV